MEKQWTTVSETVRKAQQDARGLITPSQEDVRKNRRIAMALASTGVFLILVGAAPFLFGGNDSSEYSAFLGQDPEVAINASDPTAEGAGVAADGLSDEVIDFSGESETFEVTPTGEPAVAADDPAGAIPEPPAPPIAPIGADPVPVDPTVPVDPALPQDPAAPVASEPPLVEPIAETPMPVEPTLEPTPFTEVTPTPEATPVVDETIHETAEYPINIHVGGTSDPVDYGKAIGGDDIHTAAPAQPETGAPLLPLLAFSGVAAAAWRSRKLKKNQ
jgi:hypothetical protein